MNSKEFKNVFGSIAKKYNFISAHGGWYKESAECIAVLLLQKSNFGDYYQLIIKIYVQGMFDNKYVISKDIVKKDVGDIFTSEPPEFKSIFDFDHTIDDKKRLDGLEEIFSKHIVPYSDKALSKAGIMKMHVEEGLFLLPNVRNQLF